MELSKKLKQHLARITVRDADKKMDLYREKMVYAREWKKLTSHKKTWDVSVNDDK